MMSLKRHHEDPGEKEESLGRLFSWENSSAAQGTKVARKLGDGKVKILCAQKAWASPCPFLQVGVPAEGLGP